MKSDRRCAERAAEGHFAIQGEVVEPDLYLKHVEGVEEGHLAMHSERQGEDVEGVVEGHLAIDSER